MSPLQEKITAPFLDSLEGSSDKAKWENCAKQYPWYPLPWLMLADNVEGKQRAALWMADEQRLHFLLNGRKWQEDEWLADQLSKLGKEEDSPGDQQAIVDYKEAETAVFVQKAPDVAAGTTRETILPAEETISVPPIQVPGTGEVIAPITVETMPATPENSAEAAQTPGDDGPDVATFPGMASIKSGLDPAVPAEGNLAFEPYYSVDYFASQGIKIDPATLTQTKFDRQVKSFTQWLKTMKKVNVPDGSLPSDPLVDAQASASVSEKEVITEAMAEVLEKQGKYKKAAEILGKLMLLHPEKSTFFAARIEILKEKQ